VGGQAVHPEHLGGLRADLLTGPRLTGLLREQADRLPRTSRHARSRVPRTSWDTAVKAVPHILGVLETVEDRSPLVLVGPLTCGCRRP
jgi:hypothetical protein